MMNQYLLLLLILLASIAPTCCLGFTVPNAANLLRYKATTNKRSNHQIVRMRKRHNSQLSRSSAITALNIKTTRMNNAFCSRPTTSSETTLYGKENDNDTSDDIRNNNNNNKSKTDNNKPLSDAFDAILLLFSYCTQFFGAAVSVGLLLNLCGYGYTFDFKNGLYIDKIENIRREVQFRREILRSGKDSSGGGSSSKVQKTLPSVEENLSPLLPR